MGSEQNRAPGLRFDVLVSNGYAYEYETTICANSVHEARKLWTRRGDWKSANFKVRHAAITKSEEAR